MLYKVGVAHCFARHRTWTSVNLCERMQLAPQGKIYYAISTGQGDTVPPCVHLGAQFASEHQSTCAAGHDTAASMQARADGPSLLDTDFRKFASNTEHTARAALPTREAVGGALLGGALMSTSRAAF